MTVEGRTYGGLTPGQRSENRRGRLLDAARALIAEVGVAPLTVDLVCQRANLSKRYFYTEFATKDDVLNACAEDLYTRLWAAMENVLATAPRSERMSGILRAVVRALASDLADARLYMESPGFPRLRERQRRAVREFSEQMAAHGMPFTGHPRPAINRALATQALVAGATDVIIAWLHGDINTGEDSLIATLTTAALGAAARL